MKSASDKISKESSEVIKLFSMPPTIRKYTDKEMESHDFDVPEENSDLESVSSSSIKLKLRHTLSDVKKRHQSGCQRPV